MTLDLARYMQNALDDQWKELRGMEICSVAIAPISYDDESKKLIERRNQAGILSDPSIRDTYIQTTVADGLGRAGSNSSGAMNGYVGMGMGMNVAAGLMHSVASANAQQRQHLAVLPFQDSQFYHHKAGRHIDKENRQLFQ